MQFSSLHEFLAMGGYGFYVWLSFSITIIGMTSMVLFIHFSHHRIIEQIVKEQARKERIKTAQKV